MNWPANQYDNVICVFGHFNPETQQKVLNGVRETLVNGGLFVGELYSTRQLEYKTGGPRAVEMLYDPIEFLSHFKHDHLIHFFVGDVGTLQKANCIRANPTSFNLRFVFRNKRLNLLHQKACSNAIRASFFAL